MILFAGVTVTFNASLAQVSFINNGQQLNRFVGRNVTLGDFNDDGSLDAFVNNEDNFRVYFGDGHGLFNDSGQHLVKVSDLYGKPAAGDVNKDGNLEVITGKTVWLNDGNGFFSADTGLIDSDPADLLGTAKLADFNQDGNLDLFFIVNYNAMRVYFNDGNGQFHDSGQKLGDGTIEGGSVAHLALGDLNGDGFIDAVTAGWRWNNSVSCPNHVWLGDSLGRFTETGQHLEEGQSHVHGLDLGDLNGDGRLDIVMGIQDASRAGRLYWNDGTGHFTKGANIAGNSGENVGLADFNGDEIPDVFMAQSTPPCRVWLNNGTGTLRDGGVQLGNTCTWDVAVGDFNADGKPDAFTAACIWNNNGLSPAPARIWLNTTASTKIQEKQGSLLNQNRFQLNQNYPNPFNPTTTIRFTLNKPSHVKLSIYDLVGHEIDTLTDTFQNSDEYSVVWNATDDKNRPVTSGVYFYQLETKNQSIQKKMILVR
jgi:hypothetical protein